MFVSVQGEGVFTGVPSIFMRTSGCNLRCCFKRSICDTPYSSYNPEKSIYENMDDLVYEFNKLMEENPKVRHLVITGGEPMLYKEGLDEFLKRVYKDGMVITIETNGTLPPLQSSESYIITLYSVSPKLSTSVGDANGKLSKELVEKHNNTRINIQNLCKYITSDSNIQLKYVYSGNECVNEIEDIYNRIVQQMDTSEEYYEDMLCHLNGVTMLMPEGITNEQLSKSSQEAVKVCIEKGWQFCDRMHIRVFGDKRGV